MAGTFAGKVALVTGAASGIGRAAAIRYAQEGAIFAAGAAPDAAATFPITGFWWSGAMTRRSVQLG